VRTLVESRRIRVLVLGSKTYAAPLTAAVSRSARAIAAATDAEGLSVWQNNGTQAAQSVPHLHVHVAATLPGGGTAWGPVPSLSIDETAVIADCLHPHWLRAG
jgi:histidine triad (HIT) family protein